MQFIDTHLHLQDYKTGFATDIVKEALIGECGLDGVKNPDDEPQNSVFCQHILLAEELKRPLIIHAVRAQEWLENYWDMLPAKFVFHSYNGKREVLKKILKAGGYVSFSASILRNADKEELVNMVPADKLLLETDGPYQGPDKNAEVTPVYIPRLAEKIAGWRGENLPDFAARVYQNSLEFIHVG